MEFIDSIKYKRVVDELFSNNENLDLAVAFLGIDAKDFFKKNKGKNIRYVCNFESGVCNPYLIEELYNQENIELKSNPLLHAKIFIQDSSILIGSANLSANGLSLEGTEQTAWQEVGVLSSNNTLINNSKSWFNDIWTSLKSKEITIDDINNQKENWEKRRSTRPIVKNGAAKSLISEALNGNALKNRNIHFAVYHEFASKEATDEFNNETNNSTSLDFFEDWPNLPDHSYLISIYCDANQDLSIDGLRYMPKEPMLKTFQYKDGSKAEIKTCKIIKNIEGFKLTAADKKIIREKFSYIEKCAKQHKSKPEYNAYTVSLDEWVNSFK